MRLPVFLIGIGMLIAGPLLTFLSISSCFATILSGHIFACVNDIVFVAFGGVLFLVGIIIAIVGLVMPDPQQHTQQHLVPYPSSPLSSSVGGIFSSQPSIAMPTGQPPQQAITCKKCGSTIETGQYFCLKCGQPR